ncbi:hypothetical protein [Methylorubrum zatmanii]
MTTTFRTHDGRTLQQAASDLVQREVLCCMSSMVATLAQGHGYSLHPVSQPGSKALADLTEQAFELYAPVLDYEGAARQAGFAIKENTHVNVGFYYVAEGDRDDAPTVHATAAAAWQACCEAEDIEPHELEVYELWAVSTWLAEKLQVAGERVDTDFAGLNVWARTTSGQAISIDAVIEHITREMHAA